MNKIISYFKEIIQVDRVLFSQKEYIMWWLTYLVGFVIVCLALAFALQIRIQLTIVCSLLGLGIMLITILIWVSRASNFIKRKENIGTVYKREEKDERARQV